MNQIYRKRNLKKIGIGLLVCTALSAISVAGYEYRKLTFCREEREQLENQLNSYRKTVYVAAEELRCGEIITEENVREEIRYTDQTAELFIQEEDFGKAVTADIPEGTCLLIGMTQKVTENVREVFVSEVEMTGYLEQGSRVDIRISYPNAEDYTVLSNKFLVFYEYGTGMVLQLTEEEILLLSSAIFDSMTYEDTKLYAVKYPEQELMNVGRVNYVPNKEILDMLDKESTEGERRAALEQRLKLMEK